MDLSSVKQKLESIDYDWTKPQTYLILVPGLSLVIQKVQTASLLPLVRPILPVSEARQQYQEIDATSRKFAKVCQSHFRASIIQIAVSLLAAKIFAAPLFLLLAALATYELADIVIRCVKNPVLFFHDNLCPIIEARSASLVLFG